MADERGEYILTNVNKICAGPNFTILMKNDRTVWANSSSLYQDYSGGLFPITGVLGNGLFAPNPDQKIYQMKDTNGYVTNVKDVFYEASNVFIIKIDGTVWGCGLNRYGQLGIGTYEHKNVFTQVKDESGTNYLTNVKQIAIGDGHTLFLKNDGTVWSCGSNGYGELGLGGGSSIYDNIKTIMQVKDTTGNNYLTNIIGISANFVNSSFSQIDKIFVCGGNQYGQLGLGYTGGSISLPTKVQIN